MRVQHYVMTRFAVKSPGSGFQGAFPAGWIEGRFELFERYCLPTLMAQSELDFRWLLFCHADFEPEYEERLQALWEKIEVVKGRGGLRYFVDAADDAVISTRLDSDDGLHRQAIEQVRSRLETFARSGHPRWLHNFPRGYKLDARAKRAYGSRKLNSQFLSLFERLDAEGPVRGALGGNHSTMVEEFPHEQDESLAGWLMVVHGGNVSNAIGSGEAEVPIEELEEGFPLLRLADEAA